MSSLYKNDKPTMRTPLLLFLILTVSVLSVRSQSITITPNGITPASSHPRLTYDAILALSSPAEGDIAYDITFKCLRVFNGHKWVCTITSNPDLTPNITVIASEGGPESDHAQGVAIDASGNVYVVGNFSGTANFGNMAVTTITSAGNSDVFIAKYSSTGNLQWVKSAGGTGTDQSQSIAVDATGNVYITGFYRATASFENTSITALDRDDIFVAKYDINGNFQWVKSAGSTLEDSGKGIAVDASGNVFVTGFYKLTATFDNQTVTSVGGEDIFMAKYDGSGNLQWVKSAGGTGDDRGLDIATDSNGNLYVTGHYLETATFGGSSITSTGGFDVFIAKYNGDGVIQWLRTGGGSSHDYGQSIAVSPNGLVAVTGGFQSFATFESNGITSAGNFDVFIAKYNSFGSFLWVRSAGGTGYDYGYGITVDANENSYITGIFAGSAKFGTITKTSAGNFDLFVAKYAGGGGFQWVQSAGGFNDDLATSVAIDSGNNVFFSGSFSFFTIIGNITLTSMGNSDIIIGRLEK